MGDWLPTSSVSATRRQPSVGGCSALTGEGRKRAMANGVVFGRKPKLSDFQRNEAIKRRGNGETLSAIAKTYAVSFSLMSRL
jgi:hypothetical protein